MAADGPIPVAFGQWNWHNADKSSGTFKVPGDFWGDAKGT